MAPTMTVPRTPEQLAEMLADPKQLKEVVASQDSLKEFITAYGEAQQGDGKELNRLVAEETQKVFAQMMRDNDMDASKPGIQIDRLNLDPQARRGGNMLTSHRQGTAYNPEAPGAGLDKHFKNSVDYVRTIWHKAAPTAERANLLSLIQNEASSVSPADGGFLVPETLRSQLLQIALEKSVVRPLATVVPMDSRRVPIPMIDSITNRGSVYGGMIAYWGEEGAELEDSNPKFGRVDLDAKKLTGLSAVPNELLQDSIVSFASLIERLWPTALAFEEDNAFMVGTGVGQPLGFLGEGNTAAVTVTRDTSTNTGINYIDVVNMYARMLPSSLSSAVWMCSPDAVPALLQMAMNVGTGGTSILVINAAAPMPMSLFGRPLIITEKASALGSRGDLSFVDLSYYLVGDRQTMTADSSTDYKFGADKTTFRIIQRVDGRPWLKSPITPANGSSNTLSPFVELGDAA